MDTITLCRLACSDPYIKKGFAGVFASDSLPQSVGTHTSFIINLDPKTEPGSHWTAIFFTDEQDTFTKKKSAFYFDSYGRFPTHKNILKFLVNNAANISYNFYGFQSYNSLTCGHFCLYFLYKMNRNLKLNELSRTEREKNEIFIKAFVSLKLKLAECCVTHHRHQRQTCRALRNVTDSN